MRCAVLASCAAAGIFLKTTLSPQERPTRLAYCMALRCPFEYETSYPTVWGCEFVRHAECEVAICVIVLGGHRARNSSIQIWSCTRSHRSYAARSIHICRIAIISRRLWHKVVLGCVRPAVVVVGMVVWVCVWNIFGLDFWHWRSHCRRVK